MHDQPTAPIKDTLTQQISELEKIAHYFENPELDLDEGIKYYEQGMKVAQEIKQKLKSYELKITEIREKYSAEDEEE